MTSSGIICEGLAEVLPIETNEVFYNPVQVFNRDLSIVAVSVFARESSKNSGPVYVKRKGQADSADISVFEGLAASGLRSVRYCKELQFGSFAIRANDIEAAAVERINRNIDHNKVREKKIEAINSDAIIHLQTNRNIYDVIDLDPYGSVSPFLDSALASIKHGGLLCITSTDGGVLCGNQVDLSYIRYGGFSLKRDYCHEMGIRVLLHAINQAAGRYKRAINVLAAFSIDFYFRIFVQVLDSPESSLASVDKIGFVFQCCRCEYHSIQPISGRPDGVTKAPKPARVVSPSSCPECTGQLTIGGPIWIGPIYHPEFVDKCLDVVENERESFPGISCWQKINGLLHGLKSELVDVPLFYSIPGLVQAIKCSPPKLRVFTHHLNQLGYRVGFSHRTTNAFKTDAPAVVVFDLIRNYVGFLKSENPKLEVKPMVPEILAKQIKTQFSSIDWNLKIATPSVPIYLPNPKAFWGPKPRAFTTAEQEERKRMKID